MYWLLENDVFSEGLDNLIEAIKAEGHSYHIIKYRPFGFNEYDWGVEEQSGQPSLFYGSLNLSKYVNNRTSFTPGTWCTLKNYKCSTYYLTYGPYLLNKSYAFLPVREAIRQKDWLFEQFGIDGCVFVRPDDGDKPFAGKILQYENFDQQGFELGYYYEDDSILAVISKPKIIYTEYRLFTDGETILGASSYKSAGRLALTEGLPSEGRAYAEVLLKQIGGWKPDPVFAIDIALTAEGWKVLEINSFSCSGLYACNPQPIVRRAAELAEQQFSEPF